MREAEEERKRRAEEVGVKWRWQLGNILSGNLWEKYSSEAETSVVTVSSFADDTTIVGRRDEIEERVRTIKEVMEWYEEKNHEDKEEILEFGSEEDKNVGKLDGSGRRYQEQEAESRKTMV